MRPRSIRKLFFARCLCLYTNRTLEERKEGGSEEEVSVILASFYYVYIYLRD